MRLFRTKIDNNEYKPVDLHKTKCVICGKTMEQTSSDSPKERAICYKCFQSMWGKQSTGFARKASGGR